MRMNQRQSIALTGDTLITRPISIFTEKEYLDLHQILCRADAVFTNFDSNIHRYLDDPHHQQPSAGTYMTSEPALLDELRWLNVNLVACGSTHADDYGPKGIMDTIREFDAVGIVHAGSGRHLAEARSPGYLDTANGRIALLAATGSFHHGARAGEQRADTLGWPGVNGIRSKTVYRVDAAAFESIRHLGRNIGWEKAKERAHFQGDAYLDGDAIYDFLGHSFELAETFGQTTIANGYDIEANLRCVRNARKFSDRIVASLHCHEQGGPTLFTANRRSQIEDMADFVVDYGRRCLDAGADIFVAHGPQLPLAVEIYNGKPLFHGLGTFIFQIETVKHLPSECYERYGLDGSALPGDFLEHRYQGGTRGHTGEASQWEQVFAVVNYERDVLVNITLYPLDLGFEKPASQRGRPVLAGPEMGGRILDRMKRLSAKFGTDIRIQNNTGIIAM